MPAPELPDGYTADIYRTPASPSVRSSLIEFLNHKEEIFRRDTEMRLKSSPTDLFALAFHRDQPAAHACLARSHPEPEVALLCHVFTAEDHRHNGLATHLLSRLFSTFDADDGRWATLGTTNPGAARIYRRFGFQPLNGAVDDENFIMLRTATGFSATDYLEKVDQWEIAPFERHHVPGAILLLNLDPSPGKMPLCEIDRGLKAEQKLTKLIYEQEQDRCRCHVLTNAATGRVRGVACSAGDQTQIYAPQVPEQQKYDLRRAAETR